MTTMQNQRGMSLIELMVAMVIGLLIVFVIMGLFITSNRNYIQDNSYSRMQENGRFAMKFISADLRMAGFMGRVTDNSGISNTGLAATSACGVVHDPNNPVALVNNATGTSANTAHSCIAATGFKDGSDVLIVKSTQGASVTAAGDHINGRVYLRITGTANAGQLVQSDGSASPAGMADWLYQPHIYYIRNKTVNGQVIPTLFRKRLDNATTMNDEEIAEGVENLQVQFGIDTGNDGDIDYYTTAPTAAELKTLISVRINILVRATSVDPNSTYTNTKTYNLGDGTIGPFNDKFQRRVYTSTIPVRNIFNINLMGS